MMGKFLAVLLVACAVGAGVSMYYLQVYAFYEELDPADVGNVKVLDLNTGQSESILTENLKAIDSDSSPIRFRSCFETSLSVALMTETYAIYEDAEPLVAPGWFDCFDAEEIGLALESGEAVAFLGEENITYGIDRVIAVMPDGRGFGWNQINACGEVVFDGDDAPEGCPTPPEGAN